MNYAWESNFLSVGESSITSLLRTPESAGPAMFGATIIGGNGCHLQSPSPQIAAVRQNFSPARVLHSSHVSSLDQCVLTSILLFYCILDRFQRPILQVRDCSVFSNKGVFLWGKSVQIFSHLVSFLLLTRTRGWKDPLQSSNLIHDCMHLPM